MYVQTTKCLVVDPLYPCQDMVLQQHAHLQKEGRFHGLRGIDALS